jgi:hypothetical protein
MKKSFAVLWGTLALVGLLIAGCSKDNTGPSDDNAPSGVTDESSARAYYATNDEFVQNDEATFDDQEVAPTDYGTFGKIDAPITPLRWGRFVRQVVRTVERDIVLPGDSIAIVHVHKEITGVFKIRGISAAGDTVDVEKPFVDNSDRNIIFRRFARETRRFWMNWFPVATSLVDGGTIPPNNLIDITKVDLFLANGDTITVTDPLNTYLRYGWRFRFQGARADVPQLDPAARIVVQATVVSSSPDTDLVALRYGVGTFQKRRFRMHLISEVNNGNGTYTRVYEGPFFVHFHRGFFHAGVDAITRGTLFDDTVPYSANWWGIPYRVF